MKIYFSDFFDVSPNVLEEYGAFNISLINVDWQLLFRQNYSEQEITFTTVLILLT